MPASMIVRLNTLQNIKELILGAIASGKSIPERIYNGLLNGESNKVALVVNGNRYTYKDLKNGVFSLAAALVDIKAGRLGIIARESFETYQCLYAALMTATECVPLTPIHPASRIAFIITHAQCTHVLMDSVSALSVTDAALEHMTDVQLSDITFLVLPETAALIESELDNRARNTASRQTQSFPDGRDTGADDDFNRRAVLFKSRLKLLELKDLGDDEGGAAALVGTVDSDDLLHVIYTSGTTGNPKGVMITHGNYAAYLDKLLNLFEFTSDDVFSHYAEITFDTSLADPLCAIICGGTLVCPSQRDRTVPHKYIADNGITVTQATPPLIAYLKRLRIIDRVKVNCLRLAVFAGEPLWYSQARQFHKVFPDARIVNAYGPTEGTVHVTAYEALPDEIEQGLDYYADVPMGPCLPGIEFRIVDENLDEVAAGQQGELLISGDQVSPGYWKGQKNGRQAFIELDGRHWYRTGDLVKSSVRLLEHDCYHGKAGERIVCYHYLGRNDDTVKVSSFRISLLEVEEKISFITDHQIRAIKCCEPFDGVDHPVIVAVIEGADSSLVESVKKQMPQVLPGYMWPRYMTFLPAFPLNTSGKVDRRAIKEIILEKAPKIFGLELHP